MGIFPAILIATVFVSLKSPEALHSLQIVSYDFIINMPVADFIFRIDHLRLINEDSLQLLVKNLSDSVGISANPNDIIVFLRDNLNKEIFSQLSVMVGLEEYIKLYPIEAGFACKPYKDPIVEDSIILRAWERATARVAEHSITLKRTLKYCFCPDYFRVREPKLLEHRSSTGVEIRHKELELRHAILKIDLELMILIRETFHGEKLNMEHIKMLADNFILRHTVQECANLRLLNSDNKYLAVCELCEELEFSMSEVKGLIGKYELILGLSSK